MLLECLKILKEYAFEIFKYIHKFADLKINAHDRHSWLLTS